MLKTNYHTHCYLCGHAEGLPSDYIKKAIELGFSEIGISDHAPLLPAWTIRMNKDKMENIYFKDIDEAINKYKDKIKIYKALEIEYYQEYDEYYKDLLTKVDYLILGQHALKLENTYFDIYKVVTKDLVYKYAEEVIAALNTGYFKILAHPELFIFRYPDRWDDEMDEISRKIIEAAIKNDVYLEINVNGARRGKVKSKEGIDTWQYPHLDFWKLVSEYKDAKIIINADCHKIDYLYDQVTEEVYEFAKKLNLNVSERIEL